MNRSPVYLMRERLIADASGKPRCYFQSRRARHLSNLDRYGPCNLRDPNYPRGDPVEALQAHHLLPQQLLRDLHRAGHFGSVPLSIVLADYRNGILVCPGHHHRIEPRSHRPDRLKMKLLDLPDRFYEFLTQFKLWGTAERLYVRPEGHAESRYADDLADTRDAVG